MLRMARRCQAGKRAGSGAEAVRGLECLLHVLYLRLLRLLATVAVYSVPRCEKPLMRLTVNGCDSWYDEAEEQFDRRRPASP